MSSTFNNIVVMLLVALLITGVLFILYLIAERLNFYNVVDFLKFKMIIVWIFFVFLAAVEISYQDEVYELKGTRYVVTYEYVNIREEPAGEILYTLDKGTIVTLTGEHVTFDGASHPYRHYVEITKGGWVTISALKKLE